MRTVLIQNPTPNAPKYFVYNTDKGATDYAVKYSQREAETLRDKMNARAGYAKYDIMTYEHYRDKDD